MIASGATLAMLATACDVAGEDIDATWEVSPTTVASAPDAGLLFSDSSDRSGAEPLDSVDPDTKVIHVFLEPGDITGINHVEWFVDGALHRDDDLFPPYDLVPEHKSLSGPFDLSRLGAGDHEISADVKLATGGTGGTGATVSLSAAFTIPGTMLPLSGPTTQAPATTAAPKPTPAPTTAKPAPTAPPTTAAPAPKPTPPPTPKPTPPPTTAKPAPAPAPAPSGGLPNASNTGVRPGTNLTSRGSYTVTTPGAVIQNLDISGTLTIKASNVTVRNSRIRSGGNYGIWFDENVSGIVLEDLTIMGTGPGCSSGLAPTGRWTARRLNVSGCADGVKMHGNQTLESSYIHDLRVGPTTHNDAIQVTSGNNGIIRNNNLIAPSQNAAIMMSSNFGSVDNWKITGNRFAGGTYTVYVRNQGYGNPSRIALTDNTWVTNSWQFGPYSIDGGGVTFARNSGI
jgi:hypothetical protein